MRRPYLNKGYIELKISIVTATYNCAETIAECLATVASQTYTDREHIVIDGASSDGSLGILRKAETELAYLISERDTGIYDALNKGIARATGEVVGFMHADDMYARPDTLAKIAEAFKDPAVLAVFGDLEYLNQADASKVVRRWQSGPFSPRRLRWGWMPPHPTLYVRRAWYEQNGGFDTSYKIAADYACILKLFSSAEGKFVYLPEVLVKMRLGGASNKSLHNIIRKSREDWRALRTYRVGALGGVGALVWKNASKIPQFL